MLRRAGAAQLVRQNIAIAARADRRPLLPTIRCPTLVLCGDADVVTTVDASREIAQWCRAPNSRSSSAADTC